MRLTGLQRDVLSLYRRCLRTIRKKPMESRKNFRDFARAEFKKGAAGIDRKDFAAIEYCLRRGQKQLELYSAPDVKKIS